MSYLSEKARNQACMMEAKAAIAERPVNALNAVLEAIDYFNVPSTTQRRMQFESVERLTNSELDTYVHHMMPEFKSKHEREGITDETITLGTVLSYAIALQRRREE